MLYVNALNRPADAGGLAFRTQRIQSGAQSRERVIAAFSEGLVHQILMPPSIEGGVVFAWQGRDGPRGRRSAGN